MAWGLIGTDSFGEFRQMGSYVGWNGADWDTAAWRYLSTEASEAERLEFRVEPTNFLMSEVVKKFRGNNGPVAPQMYPVEFKLKKTRQNTRFARSIDEPTSGGGCTIKSAD